MKNEGKVMENKEKVRKPCPRPKKKIPKQEKTQKKSAPHCNYTPTRDLISNG
jgi:hypothetical protein